MAEDYAPSRSRYPHRITETWRTWVRDFRDCLAKEARPIAILHKMKPPPKFDDPAIEEILNLDRENNSVRASDKFLTFLLSEDGMSPGEIAARWRAFDKALEEVNPLLYDIVNGRYDPSIQEGQRNLLNDCIGEICEQVNPQNLLPDLISRGLLGDMEKEILMSIIDNKGNTMAASYMVEQLPRSGSKTWLKDFLWVLAKNEHQELALTMSDKYEKAIKNSSSTSQPPAAYARSPQDTDSNSQAGRAAFCDTRTKETLPMATSSARPASQLDLSASGGVRPKELLQQASVNTQEQRCLTCGKTFKQLSRHTCKAASHVANNNATQQFVSTINEGARPKATPQQASVKAASQEQQCPTCGKIFKQLSRHNCKAVNQTTNGHDAQLELAANGGARPKQTPQLASVKAACQEEQCAGCGKTFKQLNRHVCKGGGQTASTRPEEKCPTCGQTFKQLSRHVCKAAKSAATTSSHQGHAAAHVVTRPPESQQQAAASTKPREEPCPTCGKVFKQLWRHVCKGPAAGATPTATHNGATASRVAQPSGAGAKPAEQQCPKCGKMFKQLSRHKCKV